LARVFLFEYSGKRLELAQLPGQLGVFLTLGPGICSPTWPPPAPPQTTECRSPIPGTRTSTASPPELHFAAECRARLGPGTRMSTSPPPAPPRTSKCRAPRLGTRSRPRSRRSRSLPLSGARALIVVTRRIGVARGDRNRHRARARVVAYSIFNTYPGTARRARASAAARKTNFGSFCIINILNILIILSTRLRARIARALELIAHQRGHDGWKAATLIVTLSSWCARPSSGGFLRRDPRTPRVWFWGRAEPRPCGYQWGCTASRVSKCLVLGPINNMGRPIG
jgi:hypothetical protein